MVIYMDDYRKAQAMNVSAHRRYDEELLCVNWNPAVRTLARSGAKTTQEPSPEMPQDAPIKDIDAFLGRVYALATQV
jgi:hypothetical protein